MSSPISIDSDPPPPLPPFEFDLNNLLQGALSESQSSNLITVQWQNKEAERCKFKWP